MKKKGLALILIALALAAIGFALMKRQAIAPMPETTPVEEAPRAFSWRFATTESDDGLPPRTEVALITGGNAYDAGTYAGSCAEIASENLPENEVSGVLCWWAGGGDEIGVFKEGERYVLKHGFQDESTAESEGFRGEFLELAVIE